MAGEGGKGKSPNHGLAASAVKIDSPLGGKERRVLQDAGEEPVVGQDQQPEDHPGDDVGEDPRDEEQGDVKP